MLPKILIYLLIIQLLDPWLSVAKDLEIETDMPDTDPPVITVIGDNPLLWIVGSTPYVDPGATAQDNIDGNLTASIVTDTSAVEVNTRGTYTVSYLVSDEAGNSATASRTVNVCDPPPDTDPPVITVIGDNPLMWIVGTTPYDDPGATAQDNIDGDLTESIVTDTSAVEVNTCGTYTVNYSVSDNAGNIATTTRTVHVKETEDLLLMLMPVIGAINGKESS